MGPPAVVFGGSTLSMESTYSNVGCADRRGGAVHSASRKMKVNPRKHLANERVRPRGRGQHASSTCPASIPAWSWHGAGMHLACTQHTTSMHPARTQHAANIQPTCNQHTASMQPACSQQAEGWCWSCLIKAKIKTVACVQKIEIEKVASKQKVGVGAVAYGQKFELKTATCKQENKTKIKACMRPGCLQHTHRERPLHTAGMHLTRFQVQPAWSQHTPSRCPSTCQAKGWSILHHGHLTRERRL